MALERVSRVLGKDISLRCVGLTFDGRRRWPVVRCHRDVRRLYCHSHWWQPLAFIAVLVVTVVPAYADWLSLFDAAPEVERENPEAPDTATRNDIRELEDRLSEAQKEALATIERHFLGRLVGERAAVEEGASPVLSEMKDEISREFGFACYELFRRDFATGRTVVSEPDTDEMAWWQELYQAVLAGAVPVSLLDEHNQRVHGDLEPLSEEARRYLRSRTLSNPGYHGWVITYDPITNELWYLRE